MKVDHRLDDVHVHHEDVDHAYYHVDDDVVVNPYEDHQ